MTTHSFSGIPRGAAYMLLSALGFALMAACVKAVSQRGIPILEIVAVRALVSLLISYLDIRRKRLSPWGHNRPLLIARGSVGALALVCVYYSVSTLPLAEATILQYLHPAFTAVLALLFLGENVQRSTLICIALCLAGLIFIVKPDLLLTQFSQLPVFSIAAALLGAFGSAVAYVLVRNLSQSEDSSVIIFYFPLVTLPFALLLMGNNFVVPDWTGLGMLILVGIFTQIGQVGLTRAMQTETAAKATAYSYVQVPISIGIGWLAFTEVPALNTWLGGLLIMGGVLVNTLWRR